MVSSESATDSAPAPTTKGRVLRGTAHYYDLLAALLTLGRERAFRERLVDLARIAPGEAVLDVGCGTGSLAIAAKQRIGATGVVHAVDASPEMVALARRKAAKRGVEVIFHTAVAESLPFPDAQFDVVLGTLMLHHLPRAVREQCAREMRRVLRPGGRVLAVDFSTPSRQRRGVLHRLHRHGHVALEEIVRLLDGARFAVEETGAVGVSDLHFALATAADDRTDAKERVPPLFRSLPRLPVPPLVWVTLGILLVAGHGMLFQIAASGLSRFVVPAAVMVGLAGLMLVRHLGVIGGLRERLRGHSRGPTGNSTRS